MIEKSTFKSLCRYSNSMTSLMKRIVPFPPMLSRKWKYVWLYDCQCNQWQNCQSCVGSYSKSPVILIVLVSVVLVRVGGVVQAPSGWREVAGLTRKTSGMILQSEVWAPAQRASFRSGTCNNVISSNFPGYQQSTLVPGIHNFRQAFKFIERKGFCKMYLMLAFVEWKRLRVFYYVFSFVLCMKMHRNRMKWILPFSSNDSSGGKWPPSRYERSWNRGEH